jgi:hypothetical protein
MSAAGRRYRGNERNAEQSTDAVAHGPSLLIVA